MWDEKGRDKANAKLAGIYRGLCTVLAESNTYCTNNDKRDTLQPSPEESGGFCRRRLPETHGSGDMQGKQLMACGNSIQYERTGNSRACAVMLLTIPWPCTGSSYSGSTKRWMKCIGK